MKLVAKVSFFHVSSPCKQNYRKGRRDSSVPDKKHQAIVQVLRDEPRVVALLLGEIGFTPPSCSSPQVVDSDLSRRDPDELKELHADNVFLFSGKDHKIAVVVEVQTTRPKHGRTLAWPCYVTSARAVHDCPAFMLVIATDRAASLGSDRIIEIGQYRFDFLPHVLGGHRGFPNPLVSSSRPR